jgi:hypothetical protein
VVAVGMGTNLKAGQQASDWNLRECGEGVRVRGIRAQYGQYNRRRNNFATRARIGRRSIVAGERSMALKRTAHFASAEMSCEVVNLLDWNGKENYQAAETCEHQNDAAGLALAGQVMGRYFHNILSSAICPTKRQAVGILGIGEPNF